DRVGVLDVGVERRRVAEVLLEHARAVEWLLAIETGEDRVHHLPHDEVDLLAHEDLLLEVAHPKADSTDLVRVGGPDATPGRAQAAVSTRRLLEPVEDRVVAHDHVGSFADDEVLRLDAPLAKLLDLFEEHAWIDHDAVADDTGDL